MYSYKIFNLILSDIKGNKKYQKIIKFKNIFNFFFIFQIKLSEYHQVKICALCYIIIVILHLL